MIKPKVFTVEWKCLGYWKLTTQVDDVMMIFLIHKNQYFPGRYHLKTVVAADEVKEMAEIQSPILATMGIVKAETTTEISEIRKS
jgi:hypothetical protein